MLAPLPTDCPLIHRPRPRAFEQVSAVKCGFLPVSQEAVLVGDVSYHDYYGILIDPEERDLIARNLGPLNKVRSLLALPRLASSRHSPPFASMHR